MTPPFPALVAEGMRRQGLSLRAFCRAVDLDPSFFSKVLAGKRSPPAEESTLRRIADLLGLNPAELIVSAGRIPSEWAALWRDPALFKNMNRLAASSRISEAALPRAKARSAVVFRPQDLTEELL